MNYERPRIEHLFPTSVTAQQVFAVHEMGCAIDWRVRKLQEFIDGNDGKTGWDLRAVCQHLQLGISSGHAAKIFKRLTGIGLREYAKRRRLKTAADRLKCTPGPVKEIAADLGYRSPRDLARRFKQVFQLTPTEFRRTHRLLDAVSSPESKNKLLARTRPWKGSLLAKKKSSTRRGEVAA